MSPLLEKLPAKIVIPTLTTLLGMTLGLASSTLVFAAQVRAVETKQAVLDARGVDMLRRLDRIEDWQELSNQKQDRMLNLLEAIAVDRRKETK